MNDKNNLIYRFKIELKDFEPTIWRLIQVPDDYTFWELRVAITDAMGWADYHLHQFMVDDPRSNEEVSIRMPLTPSR